MILMKMKETSLTMHVFLVIQILLETVEAELEAELELEAEAELELEAETELKAEAATLAQYLLHGLKLMILAKHKYLQELTLWRKHT